MVHLAMRMYLNWPTDHAIDHSSIGLNRLTIQLVFNEVSLFTFSKGTHGFDVTVPKNYLKSPMSLIPWRLVIAVLLFIRVVKPYAIDEINLSFRRIPCNSYKN